VHLKRLRRKKVLGLAIGDKSLFAAEVVAGDPPQVMRVAEFVYPPGTSLAAAEELGKALGQFLRDNQFTARAAVVGIPAKWLVVRPKEVPPADASTVTEMLRLSAEAEFSTELKDLIYDFVGNLDGEAKSVLLMATPRKHIDSAQAMCDAARLSLLCVTSSAVALGEATSRSVALNAVVLSVGPSGGEITGQSGSTPNSLRHVRAPEPQPPFVSELRRALSTMGQSGSGRQVIFWDGAGLDAAALGLSLGVELRSGDLPALGVTTAQSSVNGEGRKYAAAVALGLAGIGVGDPSVDFFDSRLAPPKEQRVPRWVIISALAAIILIGGVIFAYTDMQARQARLADMQSKLEGMKDTLADATAFVSKVSFAQAWHGGDPRYLACLRDVTSAIPEDNQTFATSLILREVVDAPNAFANAGALKPSEARVLSGTLSGKTSDQKQVGVILDAIKKIRAFNKVKLGGSTFGGKGGEVSFSIEFNYSPPKATP
jgi:hypothetical protein